MIVNNSIILVFFPASNERIPTSKQPRAWNIERSRCTCLHFWKRVASWKDRARESPKWGSTSLSCGSARTWGERTWISRDTYGTNTHVFIQCTPSVYVDQRFKRDPSCLPLADFFPEYIPTNAYLIGLYIIESRLLFKSF